MEDLHEELSSGMGPFGRDENAVATATIIAFLKASLTQRISFIEKYEMKRMKQRLELCDKTGFPNFPLGMSVVTFSINYQKNHCLLYLVLSTSFAQT